MFDNSQFFSGGGDFYSFPIEQSLRFNDDDTPYLSWTPESAGDRKTWTFSFWIKRTTIGQIQSILEVTNGSGISYLGFFNDTLRFLWNGGGANASDTTMVFRDPSAWYHIVVVWDTVSGGQGYKVYVNGESVTVSISSPTTDTQTAINDTPTHHISTFSGGGSYPIDGYLAEVNFLNGIAATADDFGELKNGVWIPKEYTGAYDSAAQVTAGNLNGFRLSFADDAEVEAFNTTIWRGDSSTSRSITGYGFAPDLVWIKDRNTARGSVVFDVIRGQGNYLRTEETTQESTSATPILTAFNSDGFTLGNNAAVNNSGETYVGWGWKAGGTPTVDNSAGAGSVPTPGSVKIDGVNSTSELAGSLPAIRLSASTTYGFSIVTWQANNQTVGTVAHGLGVAPDFLIIKNRDSSTNAQWVIGHSAFGFNGQGYLNLTAGFGTNSGSFNNTAPTSTVFTVGTDQTVNLDTNKYIGYCWAETSGYSKIDGYSGSASEITVYTTDDGTASGANPFKPAFVFIKRSDSDTDAYSLIFDNTRDVEGDNGRHLFANLTNTESDSVSRKITFNDNGFTIPADASADASVNAGSGSTYIYAAFADTREAAFWLDQSGNDNDWQPVNLDHNDTVADSPTNNFCTLNSVEFVNNSGYLSEGNLKISDTSSSNLTASGGTIGMKSGKWYWEAHLIVQENGFNIGVVKDTESATSGTWNYTKTNFYAINGIGTSYVSDGAGGQNAAGTSFAQGDTVRVAYDADTGKLYFGKNDTWLNSADPAAGTGNLETTSDPEYGYHPVTSTIGDASGYSDVIMNFGQNSTLAGGNTDDNGIGDFAYAPPSGFLALCTANLPDPVIDPAQDATPEDYFSTVLYDGDNSANKTIPAPLSPDLTWIKARNGAYNHILFDSVRGTGKYLASSQTFAENWAGDLFPNSEPTTNGFIVDGHLNVSINESGKNYVAWNWKAGTSFSNDASATSIGTVDSNGSVSTESGFSIVRFNSGASGTQSFKHGLTQRPDLCFFKEKDSGGAGDHWVVWEGVALNPAQSYGYLNLSNSFANDSLQWSDTAPTDSIFTYNSGWAWSTSQEMIAYCFHSVEGYSKIGSYTGGSDPFVYLGFEPAMIIFKRATGTSTHWAIRDNARKTDNPNRNTLYPSKPDGEYTGTLHDIDFLSNGFKIRNGDGLFDASATYIYAAWAKTPFKYGTGV